MKLEGGCGRGALWYGDELAVIRGRMTAEDEELPEHERTDTPFAPHPSERDPLRQRDSLRSDRRSRVALRDPLRQKKTDHQLHLEWELANGIYDD